MQRNPRMQKEPAEKTGASRLRRIVCGEGRTIDERRMRMRVIIHDLGAEYEASWKAIGGPPAGSVEQKSAWDWRGILSFGELLSPACLQRDGKEKPKSTEKRLSPRAAPPQQCPAAPRPHPSRRCPLSFLPVTYGKRRGMQRGCAPFPYVQGTRPRRRTGLAAAAGERMAGRALTGRRSPLYDGFPTGRRPPAREPRRASSARARAAVPRGGRAARQGAAAGPIRCGGRPGPA